MTAPSWKGLLALGLALASVGLRPSPVQAAPPDETEQRTWSLEDSEEVRSRLAEARRLADRGVLDRASLLLQEVLDRFPDHLVRSESDASLFVGARPWVHARIGAMNEAARTAYEKAVGPVAEAALARAMVRRDPVALEEVAERYLMVRSVGPRALLAVSDLRAARGEADRALPTLRRLRREFPGAGAPESATIAREAVLLARLGDAAGLAALRGELPPDRLAGTVRRGDEELPLGALLDRCVAEAGTVPPSDDCPTLGGDGTRRSLGNAPAALGARRWEETGSGYRWTNLDNRQASNETSVAQALSVAEPVVPAIVDGTVYLHWNFLLQARDLYTGRELWKFTTPWHGRSESSRTHPALMAAPAVSDGIVYAPLQVEPPPLFRQSVQFAGHEIIPFIPHRRLFAVEASTGRLLWSHALPAGEDDPFRGPLLHLNVNSPPLVVGDLVIASGANYRGQFTLWTFAAEKTTGKVRWISRLGYGQQELNLFGRPMKEIAVAAAATDGERLFIQSNMGFVSCLDAATGRPLWTRGYSQVRMPFYENFWTTPEREFTFTGSPPVVSEGVVVVAPADGESLLAMDAATGRTLWTHPRSRGRLSGGGFLFRLLGADARRVYAAGSCVQAFDLRGDGNRPAWSTDFDGSRDTEVSSGRGIIGADRILVPSNRTLYSLDPATGKVLARETLTSPGPRNRLLPGGGNLVAAEGAVVVARLDTVQGYFDEAGIQARVAARLRDRPRDPEALLEAARILQGAGRAEEALPYFERALASAEALEGDRAEAWRRSAREGIFRIHITRGEERHGAGDPVAAAALFRRAAAGAPHAEDAVRALLLAAAVLSEVSVGDPSEPLDEILRDHPDVLLTGGDAGASTAAALALQLRANAAEARGDGRGAANAWQAALERPATDLLGGISARTVARDSLENLLRRFGRDIYSVHEAAAGAALARARERGDATALAEVSRRWPVARVAVLATLEEARVRLAGGDPTGAVDAARRCLASSPDAATEVDALWTLARALAASRRGGVARATLERLLATHPDASVQGEDGLEPVSTAVPRRLAMADLAPPPPTPAPSLPREGPWRTLWSRPLDPSGGEYVLPVEGEPWPEPMILVAGDAGTVDALRAADGTPAWRATLSAPPYGAAVQGALVILAGSDGLVALRVADGTAAWTRPSSPVRDFFVRDGLLLALEDGDSRSFVRALDPASGEPLWTDPLPLPGIFRELLPVEGGALLVPVAAAGGMYRIVDTGRGALRVFGVPARAVGENASAEVVSPGRPLLLRRFSSLVAYEPVAGVPLWTLPLSANRLLQAVTVVDGAVAVVDHREVIEVLEAATGASRWVQRIRPARRLIGALGNLTGDGKAFFTVSTDRESRKDLRIDAWSAADGKPLWSTPLSDRADPSELGVVDGLLVARTLGVAGGTTSVVVMDPVDGSVVDRFVDDELVGQRLEVRGGLGALAVITEGRLFLRGR